MFIFFPLSMEKGASVSALKSKSQQNVAKTISNVFYIRLPISAVPSH